MPAKCGFRLELHRWETDAYPGFHAEGPQGLIDPTLKIADRDIVIGIFWKRFGKPTADGRTGTEHELRTAIEAWKGSRRPQVMVYFNQKAYSPKSPDETDQWGQVLRFQKSFPKEGLWWPYKGPQQFAALVRNHLTNFIRQLGTDETASASAAALNALHSLPPPPGDFTGRETELAELREAIEHGGVHISGLQGQGGVGKTALALKLADELRPAYPDAQIYMDLRGASAQPLTPSEALAYVIRACHPESKLPESETELRAAYLSVLHGKRALLLMDNARDAAQVAPLVPPAGCALLMTSRNRFTLAGLKPKDLDTLSPADAAKLLLEIESRIDGEAAGIAKLCGYLPLALRLAASALAERPDLAPADYARRLEKERLKLLASKPGDEHGVEASIGLSYGLLDAATTQKRWRMLGVCPESFDLPAAAAVWEAQANEAEDALGSLLQASMVQWNDSARRYRLHDLMRDFARARLAEAGEAEGAAPRAVLRGGARPGQPALQKGRRVHQAGIGLVRLGMGQHSGRAGVGRGASRRRGGEGRRSHAPLQPLSRCRNILP
ncbi:MAG: NB-ARC domain-containing protein [Terriglobia bacterium]